MREIKKRERAWSRAQWGERERVNVGEEEGEERK